MAAFSTTKYTYAILSCSLVTMTAAALAAKIIRGWPDLVLAYCWKIQLDQGH